MLRKTSQRQRRYALLLVDVAASRSVMPMLSRRFTVTASLMLDSRGDSSRRVMRMPRVRTRRAYFRRFTRSRGDVTPDMLPA